MDPPTVPEGFLQLCIKYEYFKRNCTQQANENICEMINRLGIHKGLQFPDTEEDLEEYPKSVETAKEKPSESVQRPGTSSEGPPPKKRKIENVEEDKEESDPEEAVPGSDPDSDDHEIIPSESEDEVESEVDPHGILKKAKWLYKRFSEKEIEECGYFFGEWEPIDYLKLIPIQRIVNTTQILILLNTGSNFLNILIGYRKISMQLKRYETDEDAWLNLTYMSSEKGCLVWYGDRVWIEKTLKYQSLAAKEFYYLLNHRDASLESLEIEIEDYKKWDPPTWPFSSFHQKISKYISKYDYLSLKIQSFHMKVPTKDGITRNGQEVLMTIWKLLDPEDLENVTLRVWDDDKLTERRGMRSSDNGELLSVLYQTDQWKNAKTMDISDGLIATEGDSFESFLHFEVVHLKLEEEQFPNLIRAAYENGCTSRTQKCSFFVNDKFNLLEAAEMFENELKDLLPVFKAPIVDGTAVAPSPPIRATYQKIFQLKNGLIVKFNRRRWSKVIDLSYA